MTGVDGAHAREEPCPVPTGRERVTLQQVAHRAGVSRTTASFVLSGRYVEMRISEDARDRVLRAAAELSYRPNLMAQSLSTRSTRTIALVSDTIASEPYAGHLVYGALAAAVRHEHVLVVAETEGDPVVESRLIDDLIDRQVDGFVYASMYTREVEVPERLRKIPHILVNCLARNDPAGEIVGAVVPDETGGGRAAAAVLLEAGHRDGIWLLGETPQRVVAARQRLAGVEAALAEAGTSPAGTLPCTWWPDSAFNALTAALRTGPHPEALICLNDRVALGAYQAAQEAGLDIPGDISIVSFDDSELASWLRPGLTSIGLPHFELSYRAVQTLLDADQEPVVQQLAMPVRRRGSVGPPRGMLGPRPAGQANSSG